MRAGFSIYIILMLVLLGVFGVSTAEADDVSDKATLCAGCHGADGISVSPMVPNLAGQKEDYLVKALKDFRDGKRKEAIMMSIAQNLTDKDIADLAAHFTGLRSSANDSTQH